jgi:hypothetical protein
MGHHRFKARMHTFLLVLDRGTRIDFVSHCRDCTFHLELIHDQLPLAVPCYDLHPVTELTVGRVKHGRRVLPAPLC